MSAAYARPQQQPYSPAVSTIPQEPSDYATSSYAGSHAGSHAGEQAPGGLAAGAPGWAQACSPA